MTNLIQVSNDIKNLSDEQLQQHLLQPNGTVPSFLVLSELGRRKDVRNDYAARQQGGNPQMSMAEEYSQGLGGPANSNYANAVKQGEQGMPGQPPQGMSEPPNPMGPSASPPQMPSAEPQGFAEGGPVAMMFPEEEYDEEGHPRKREGFDPTMMMGPLGLAGMQIAHGDSFHDIAGSLSPAYGAAKGLKLFATGGEIGGDDYYWRDSEGQRFYSPQTLPPIRLQAPPPRVAPIGVPDNTGIPVAPRSDIGIGTSPNLIRPGGVPPYQEPTNGNGVVDFIKRSMVPPAHGSLDGPPESPALESVSPFQPYAPGETGGEGLVQRPLNSAWPAEPDAPAGVAAARDPNGPAGAPNTQGLRGAAAPPGGGGGAGGGRSGASAVGMSLADYYAQMQGIKLPDRYGELAAENAKDKAALTKDRETSKGEALLTAGLAIAAGKSPNAITNIGEGGLAGVKNWNESTKELRQASRDLRNADQAIAIAQANRDERGLENAMKLKQHAEDLASRSADRAASAGIAASARQQALELKKMELDDSARNRLELQEQHRLNGFREEAKLYTSEADRLQGRLLSMKNEIVSTPEQEKQKQALVAETQAKIDQLSEHGRFAGDSLRIGQLTREVRLGNLVVADTEKPGHYRDHMSGKLTPMKPGMRFMKPDYSVGVWRE